MSNLPAHGSLRHEIRIELDLQEIATQLAAQLVETLGDELIGGRASPWMDIRRAADYLGCSVERVRKLVMARKVPFHQDQPGARIFFHRRELDEWLLGL